MLRVPCHFVCDCRWEGASARVRVYTYAFVHGHISTNFCALWSRCVVMPPQKHKM